MPRRLLALLAPFAALALLLAGCGDDDDDGADETTTTTEAGGDEAPEDDDGGDGTTEPDATTTAPDATTTEPDGGGDDDGFCAAFEDIGDQFGTIDDSDLDSLREGVRETAAEMEDLVEEAPEELRDDLELLAGAFEQIADEADAADSVEEFETAAEPIFSEPEYDAAGDRVSAWTDENCDGSGAEDGGEG